MNWKSTLISTAASIISDVETGVNEEVVVSTLIPAVPTTSTTFNTTDDNVLELTHQTGHASNIVRWGQAAIIG